MKASLAKGTGQRKDSTRGTSHSVVHLEASKIFILIWTWGARAVQRKNTCPDDTGGQLTLEILMRIFMDGRKKRHQSRQNYNVRCHWSLGYLSTSHIPWPLVSCLPLLLYWGLQCKDFCFHYLQMHWYSICCKNAKYVFWWIMSVETVSIFEGTQSIWRCIHYPEEGREKGRTGGIGTFT